MFFPFLLIFALASLQQLSLKHYLWMAVGSYLNCILVYNSHNVFFSLQRVISILPCLTVNRSACVSSKLSSLLLTAFKLNEMIALSAQKESYFARGSNIKVTVGGKEKTISAQLREFLFICPKVASVVLWYGVCSSVRLSVCHGQSLRSSLQ